jgi:23S rRNA pseudouridine1911/1915/1917 synthase
MIVQREAQVDPAHAGRADRVVQQLTGLTRKQVTGLFDHGCVTVNGAPCPHDFTPVAPGDRVQVAYDPHTRYRPQPTAWKDTAFRIVYEDGQVLVVDKAAWTLTVPTAAQATRGKTLADRVSAYLSRGRADRRAHVVHRLDRGTSGLLVFATSYTVAQQLKTQFAAHKPRREYLALVAGNVAADRGTFRSFLATAENLDRYSTADEEEGELAVTHYRVERRLTGATLVRCTLETGKRNQIRVQFAEAGHPVLGDERYRPDLALVPGWKFHRLALHASILGFTHPTTGAPLLFESPLPGEMETASRRLTARKTGRA